MSKDRVIHLLTDEEISYILSGLRFLGQEYVKQDNSSELVYVQSLYTKVENSADVGVIGSERM